MSNIFDKFNKIWVNDNEIDLAELETHKGKYHIDNYQTGDGNVNVKFQLKENENLTPGIFDGNEQIKNITLSKDFNIEIENGTFAGLTKLSEKSKQTISNEVGGEVFDITTEEPQTYTVTFKDGEETIKTVTGETGTTVEAPAELEKEGYEFKGWSTDGETVLLPISNIGEEDVVYLAVWAEVEEEPEEPEFIPNTVYFISYNDNEGTIEYARGSVETTNVIKDGKTKVKVLTNTIEKWKNLEFYVDSNAKEDDNNFYQLFELEDDNLKEVSVWVKLFSTEPKQEEQVDPEEPIKKFYFSIGQEEVTEDNYKTVNNAHQVSEYPSEVQEFTPEVNNENVYILVKKDKTIVVTQPNISQSIINTFEQNNINDENDEYKVVHYNKITGTINIQIS